ncbi:hypothetical protein A3C94_01295 [Candidatus Kaiserbacteria bacterium RIFCSPHIGHO2_02_FULL_55_17]|uniref:Uncharacterized protein n=1 Tax=Candidatus Kaiserbacteria bacterium RIFCSPHIGHO2_02_FULL_55_17 TaxID=1798496 RepID=A0A1F6DUB4_9BACT|nr:MAG: hypothetical protein A3C94_01295 [Candidatus Kaiserbacteria bacterium RIFCSPHIGHO2_02_FULL_55_17]
MNHHIVPAKAGLALGALVGGVHLVWSILIALGWAQALVNFSLWAHMVSAPVVIKAFDLSAAVTVIIIATIIGYVIGYIFAHIWNRLHRD